MPSVTIGILLTLVRTQQLTLHPHRCVVEIVPAVQADEVVMVVVVDSIAVDTIVVAPHLHDMEDTPIDLLPLVTRLRTGVIPPQHHDKTMCTPLATEPGERNMFPRGGRVRGMMTVRRGGRHSILLIRESQGDVTGTSIGVIGEEIICLSVGLFDFV